MSTGSHTGAKGGGLHLGARPQAEHHHISLKAHATPPITMSRSGIVSSLWLQDNLNAMILFVAEDGIAMGSFGQTQTVCDYKRRINIASLNTRQQRM